RRSRANPSTCRVLQALLPNIRSRLRAESASRGMEPLHVLRAPVRKRTATACVFALSTFVPASASPQNGRVLDRSPAIAGAQPGVFVDAAQGVFVEGLS